MLFNGYVEIPFNGYVEIPFYGHDLMVSRLIFDRPHHQTTFKWLFHIQMMNRVSFHNVFREKTWEVGVCRLHPSRLYYAWL